MATETDTSPSGWNTETLKQLFSSMHTDLRAEQETRFGERERLNAERFAAVQLRVVEQIAALRTEILAGIASVEIRLTAMDRATVILAENVNRVPTLLDREVGRIITLTDEKFHGVQRQFNERDVRTEANSKAAETAVNAALSAQKEAVAQQNAAYAAAGAKSEAATTKQIDSIVALLGSQSAGLNDKITSINARLDRDAGAHSGSTATLGTFITIVAIGIALLGVGVNFINSRNPVVITEPAGAVVK